MHAGVAKATALPLHLIAIIVSYIDDIADIARVTRTSRLLYYMTLPQLYTKVHLHSYGDLRYVNGRPEGFGSGSPFMMALNGLVVKEHGKLVQEMRLWGKWREVGVEEFGLGRVPDNTMMLNSLLRVAVDRMSKLETFSWELDCKPLKTLYQGLAGKNTLTTLRLRFPSSKDPRPGVVIPPLPNLRAFSAYDIDPLCYPDDISLMLLHSRKLTDLRLHFSPRMRQAAEPTLSLESYFGRCIVAGYKIKCKHFALQNFFGPNLIGLDSCFDIEQCHSTTFFDTFGGTLGSARNKFIDDTWAMLKGDEQFYFKTIRCNEIAPQHVSLLSRSSGLERIYFVNNRDCTPYSTPASAGENGDPIFPSPTPSGDRESVVSLGKDYLYALTRNHGTTMKHMLLKHQWALSIEDLGDIIRYCPNLEQLGVSLSLDTSGVLKLLMPFLTQLKSVRILENEWLSEWRRTFGQQGMMEMMSYDLLRMGETKIKHISVGDVVYEITKGEMPLNRNGETVMGRELIEVDRKEVQHIEIWGMDSLDIDADPIVT
ncbi:hypothetical protein K431DRAFT_322657 [Polychaeton citri CBS 116435]|uniref:F-box domain-containing protein n=1 Tax=Polychaeton citri CBS 116435 TaxID=1314669 RepID=A0A9P4Q237_9PEZI|nr:hypothetical protein K431DRAFT_322657 [Polychaeton citri CBS 116435]